MTKSAKTLKVLGLPGAAVVALLLAPAGAQADETAKPDEGGLQLQYQNPTAGDNDPLEQLNRVTSGFNSVVRGLILDPLVEGYKAVTPDEMQRAISNAAGNLSEPVTAVSSLLQGDTDNAGNATKRFLINSTVGIGGLNDPAADMGIKSRQEDLGQAFGAGGTEAGPHIVLPILGPSNLRDATGDILTSFANPLPLIGKAAQGTVQYSDNKEAINAATANSVDPYTTEKTLYEQHRSFEISNGQMSAPADGPTLVQDDAPSVATKPAQ